MASETSIRALLFIVADLKKYIKITKLTLKQRNKLYLQLHDILGELVYIQYNLIQDEMEGRR